MTVARLRGRGFARTGVCAQVGAIPTRQRVGTRARVRLEKMERAGGFGMGGLTSSSDEVTAGDRVDE
jgi:hypothetical protein